MPAAAKLNAQMVDLLSTVFDRCWSCGLDGVWPPGGANIVAGGQLNVVMPVPGARLGDPCVAGHDQLTGLVFVLSANVDVAGWVRVVVYNPTAIPQFLPQGVLTACVRVRYAI